MVQLLGLCQVSFKADSIGQHKNEPCTVGVFVKLAVACIYVIGACG